MYPFSKGFFPVVCKSIFALFLCALLLFTVQQKVHASIFDNGPPRITVTFNCAEGDIPFEVVGSNVVRLNPGVTTCSPNPTTGILPVTIECVDISGCYVISAKLIGDTRLFGNTGLIESVTKVYNGPISFSINQNTNPSSYFIVDISANDYSGNISITGIGNPPNPKIDPSYFTIQGKILVDPAGNCNGTAEYSGSGASVTSNIGTIHNQYEILGIPYGSNVSVNLTGVPSGFSRPTCSQQPKTYNAISQAFQNQNFYIAAVSKISGKVVTDYDHNAAEDSYDTGNAGTTVTLTGCNQTIAPITTPSSGAYTFENLPACNEYRLSVSNVKAGYTMDYDANKAKKGTQLINLSAGGTNYIANNFYVTPLYRISGNIFIDNNFDEKKGSDPNYTAATTPITISPTSGNAGGSNVTAPTSSGAYSALVISGQYSVEYPPPLPTGYYRTYPKNNPASFTVGVGNSAGPANFQCNKGAHNTASCSGAVAADTALTGSLQDVNFGISNSQPWAQCVGADCRRDSGYVNPVPDDANSCPVAAFASVPLSTNPGVIFSGNSNFSFCPGGVGTCTAKASSTQWVVKGDSTNSETFTPRYSGNLATSFSALYSKIVTKGGLTPTPLENVCTPSSCNLNAIPKGVYTTTSNVNINASNIPGNRNIIILVGDINSLSTYKTVTIRGDIKVPTSSTLTLSVRGDISIEGSVGVAANSTATSIEGFYSADRDIIINSASAITCDNANPDKRINFGGTVIANASFGGGSLKNNRNLCVNNKCPNLTFTERPDFFINAPETLKNKSLNWKEQAP